MNGRQCTKSHSGVMSRRRSNRRLGRTKLLSELLEARHLLSAVPGMESNWVMADDSIQFATDADGFVYTGRLDEGAYKLSKYEADGTRVSEMQDVTLLSAAGLNYVPLNSFIVTYDLLYVHDDGSIYVGGTFSGTVDFADSNMDDLTSAGETDVFVAKFNSGGAGVWSQRFGGPAADELVAFDVDGAGNVIAAGSFSRTATFDTGDTGHSLTSTLNRKLIPQFVFKLDSSTGAPVWERQLQDAGEVRVHDVEVGDSEAFVLAFFPGTVTLNGVTCTLGTHVVKMESDSRDISWVHRTGGQGVKFVPGPDAELYVVGDFEGTEDFGPAGTLTASADHPRDVFVLRIDEHEDGAGAENIWVHQFDCNYWMSPRGIAVVGGDDPALVVSGAFLGTAYFDDDPTAVLITRDDQVFPSDHYSHSDTYLVEMQLNGHLERVRQAGGLGFDGGTGTLVAHPQLDAFNVVFKSRCDIVHTPAGSVVNVTGDLDSVLVHVNRQAPQLEVVHVDGDNEEIVSSVAPDSLSFRANIVTEDGQSQPATTVTWTIDPGTPDAYTATTGADLVLTEGYLAVGRHTIQASVTDHDSRTVQYAYTFDVTPAVQSYEYTEGTSLTIPDRKSVNSTIAVDDVFTVASLNVTIVITHARPTDLTVTLRSPAGTTVSLPLDGGNTDAFNGQPASGDWTLTVKDGRKGIVGTLDSWSLHFTGVPMSSPVSNGATFGTGFAPELSDAATDAVWSRMGRGDAATFQFEQLGESLRIVDQVSLLPAHDGFVLKRIHERLRVAGIRTVDRALAEHFAAHDPFENEETPFVLTL